MQFAAYCQPVAHRPGFCSNLRLDLIIRDPAADTFDMTPKKSTKTVCRCAYTRVCYLAEELRCFGYRTDCVLYLKSNNETYSEERFHEAMNTLINKTRARYERLPK